MKQVFTFQDTNLTFNSGKGKGKMHPCTGTEALHRPYGPKGE